MKNFLLFFSLLIGTGSLLFFSSCGKEELNITDSNKIENSYLSLSPGELAGLNYEITSKGEVDFNNWKEAVKLLSKENLEIFYEKMIDETVQQTISKFGNRHEAEIVSFYEIANLNFKNFNDFCFENLGKLTTQLNQEEISSITSKAENDNIFTNIELTPSWEDAQNISTNNSRWCNYVNINWGVYVDGFYNNNGTWRMGWQNHKEGSDTECEATNYYPRSSVNKWTSTSGFAVMTAPAWLQAGSAGNQSWIRVGNGTRWAFFAGSIWNLIAR